MDSYRGILVKHGPTDATPGRADNGSGSATAADLPLVGDDDIGQEAPPVTVGQDERRMQVRAYNYWTSLLGDRPIPQIKDLTAAERPDFVDHAVVLDFSAGIANPAVTMLGQKLADECGAPTSIKWLSEVPGRSLLSRITDHFTQILANEAPIAFEAEFVNQRGKTLVCRGILLPFVSDGDTIQHILGVINWKELADPVATAELRHELEIADSTGRLPNSSPQLSAWADGPATAETAEPDVAWPLTADRAGWGLAEWLAAARESAEAARNLKHRRRAALYAAIGWAWDFALAAQDNPVAFGDLLVEAGLVRQARAPMTPVAKLVFGAEYNKSRLAEIVTVLAHARRLGLERGGLAGYLAEMPGGLSSLVREERRLQRAEAGRQPLARASHQQLAERLRKLPALALQDIGGQGSEFAVLLIRRLPQGGVCWLGEVSQDSGLIERAARHLLR